MCILDAVGALFPNMLHIRVFWELDPGVLQQLCDEVPQAWNPATPGRLQVFEVSEMSPVLKPLVEFEP
jgi:hypothetical protein